MNQCRCKEGRNTLYSKQLIIELPSYEEHCQMGCKHCIHEESNYEEGVSLTEKEIVGLLEEGRKLGFEKVILYPHRSDVTLNFKQYKPFFKKARELGFWIKSITSGASHEGMKALLPWVDQLSFSVDSLDRDEYTHFRSTRAYANLWLSLDHIAHERSLRELPVTALVMVDKSTMNTVERRCKEIWNMGFFDRIKVRELLPLGKAKKEEFHALNDDEVLHVSLINQHYGEQQKSEDSRDARACRFKCHNRIVLPEVVSRGCCSSFFQRDTLVVGPHGELSDCVLLYYMQKEGDNLRTYDSLEALMKVQNSGTIFACEQSCNTGTSSCIARTKLGLV